MLLLYTAGLYLVLIGLYSLLNDADIYIGFLWVIDLGVGLVFFIFMLHFTSFLHHKSQFNTSIKINFLGMIAYLISLLLLYVISYPSDSSCNTDLSKLWFFHLSHIDYYGILHCHEVSELNMLRDSYFTLNTFEFFSINFSLFFGLIAAILMYFMIQKIFNHLNYSQIKDIEILSSADSGFFIRNQNFITQQNTPQVVRIWSKNKSRH